MLDLPAAAGRTRGHDCDRRRDEHARLAFHTFGNTSGPFGSEVMHGVHAMLPAVFAAAETMDGFSPHAHQARSDPARSSVSQVFGPWGPFALPRFYDGGILPGTVTQASTLSLRRDIGSVRDVAYGGPQQAAFARRCEWLRRP